MPDDYSHDDEPDLGFGDEWTPDVRTFLGATAFVRSLLSMHGVSASTAAAGTGKSQPVEGTVAVRFKGKWNHGAHDVVSVLMRPEVARDLAESLSRAADAAEDDVHRWRKMQGERSGRAPWKT